MAGLDPEKDHIRLGIRGEAVLADWRKAVRVEALKIRAHRPTELAEQALTAQLMGGRMRALGAETGPEMRAAFDIAGPRALGGP
jgi:hypothetical protein